MIQPWMGRPSKESYVTSSTAPMARSASRLSFDAVSRTGLSVHAELDQATYPTGIKIPDQQMKALQDNGTLLRHTFHGEWNYTLRAQPDTPDPE